ncbi:hypothetical protein LQW54_001801 [Pestalotiopsis sp. IQ-011]
MNPAKPSVVANPSTARLRSCTPLSTAPATPGEGSGGGDGGGGEDREEEEMESGGDHVGDYFVKHLVDYGIVFV